MFLGAAVHGEWCGARTYPTRCRFCGQSVYYFACRCGSKVFFSELGGTWPEHRCIEMLRETYGDEFVQRGMALQMMKSPSSRLHTPIEERYEAAVRGQLRRQSESAGGRIRRVDASAGRKVKDTAVVRAVVRDVDLYGKFRLSPESSLAKAFLGVLGRRPFGQLTVHVGHLPKGEAESYTAFVDEDVLIQLKLENGDLVEIKLAAVTVGNEFVWLCSEIEFMPFSLGQD